MIVTCTQWSCFTVSHAFPSIHLVRGFSTLKNTYRVILTVNLFGVNKQNDRLLGPEEYSRRGVFEKIQDVAAQVVVKIEVTDARRLLLST